MSDQFLAHHFDHLPYQTLVYLDEHLTDEIRQRIGTKESETITAAIDRQNQRQGLNALRDVVEAEFIRRASVARERYMPTGSEYPGEAL